MSFFVFKQKTADELRISDWSSDVCSSDLVGRQLVGLVEDVLGHCVHRRYLEGTAKGMNAYDACTSQAFPSPVWNGGPARFQGSALSRHNVDGTPGSRPLAYRPCPSAKTVRLRVRGPASTIH